MSGIAHLISEKEYSIYGKVGNFNKILCSDITVGVFNAGTLIASDVVFSSFTANVLNANTANIDILNTSDIYAGNGFFSNDVIINGSLYASNIVISDASYNTITVSDGNIAILNTQTINNSSDINTFTLNVTDLITTTNLRVNNDLYVENNFSADEITTSDIRAGNILNDNDMTTLFLRVSDTGFFTNIKTSDMDAGYIGTDTLIVDFKLDALRGDFIEMNALTGDVETLTAHTIVTSDIKTDTATIGILAVSDINVNLLTVNSLVVSSDALIQNLNVVTTTTSPNIISNQINTLSLVSTSDISTSTGYIDTLRSSDIYVENIKTFSIFSSDIVTGGLQVDNTFKLKNTDNMTTSIISSNNTNNSFFQLPSMILTSDTVLCNDTSANVTNKTITSLTNNVAANGLHSSLGIVDNSASIPVLGNVLTITNTSPLTSNWAPPSGGVGVINSSDIYNDLGNPGQLLLTNTNLVPGSYGSADNVPTIGVASTGRIQTVTNTPILISGTSNVTPLSITAASIANSTISSTKLALTGVVAGSYTNPNLSINSQGQVVMASNGASLIVINSSDIINDLANPGALLLTTPALLSPGSYGSQSIIPTFTVNNKGRIEQIGNNSVLINGNTQILANTIDTTKLIDGSITTVKIGAGQVTATSLASNAVTGVKISNLAVTGAKIAAATIASSNLINTGVTAGSYTNTNLTVNSQGQITAASNGSGGATGNINQIYSINSQTLSPGGVNLVCSGVVIKIPYLTALWSGVNLADVNLYAQIRSPTFSSNMTFQAVSSGGLGSSPVVTYTIAQQQADHIAQGSPTGNQWIGKIVFNFSAMPQQTYNITVSAPSGYICESIFLVGHS